jgi:hypothetical protein
MNTFCFVAVNYERDLTELSCVQILEGRSYRLPFHWVGVVNRSQNDLNVDMVVAKQREHDFFSCTMEYRHLAHRMGSEFLMRNLSRVGLFITSNKIKLCY